jgi:hypothetical protein
MLLVSHEGCCQHIHAFEAFSKAHKLRVAHA